MITHFNDSDLLVPTGNSTFIAPVEAINMTGATSFTVAQGYLEGSNVSVVTEMVDMIANMRSYEASNNVIKNYSDLMEQLIANQSNIA
jgi:flagellar basal body rod protein FlgG